MDRIVSERALIRRRFTLCSKNVERLLSDSITNETSVEIDGELKRLNSIFQELSAAQNKWYSIFLDSERNDDIEEELQTADRYEATYYKLEAKVQNISRNISTVLAKSCCSGDSDAKHSRHYRLPKLQLPKFNGEVKRWLVFWAQFNKIHIDDNIDRDDKFQYLLQCMEEGSSAHELVKSFPPTGDNYENAIKQLQARFARKDLLIEHYVRELIQLVIAQTKSDAKIHSTRTLYDKLMTQILALESMGITRDAYAAFLYPMVESALPEETLRAWNRSSQRNDFYSKKNEDDKETSNLSKLLDFIKREVESEESIQLSRGFTVECKSKTPTASFLTEAVGKGKCVWCDKQHPSSECNNATKMSLNERKQYLKKKNACFRCFNVGHQYFKCKKIIKCIVCSRAHHPIMCPGLLKTNGIEKNNIEPGKRDNENEIKKVRSENKDDKPVVMKQAIGSSTVLLQTIRLNVVHNGKSVAVRALLDSGAQRSFVKSDIVDILRIEPDGEENLRHNLFGGVVTQMKSHRTFVLNCQSLDGTYKFNLDALESKVICEDLPKVRPGYLLSKLKAKGITLSDCDDNSSVISLLIGSNVLGSLYTGRSVHVSENLIAVETKMGWTVQGPTIGMYFSCPVSNINKVSFDVNDLWNLETLGIKDEASVQSIKKRDEEVERFFNDTINVDNEGRYEVRLPWKETGDILSTNYELAFKRLESTTKKLKKLELLKEYDNIFNEWRDMGIIEEIDNDNSDKGHYLPHHVVIRDSSLTTRLRPVFDASAVTRDGVSLNSCLEKGTNLISLILPLLIGFRKGAIGITSDIRKAFLQISIHPSDREYLKFLWWQDMSDIGKRPKVFRHRRVVFGVTTSPFLLAATISYHLQKYRGDTAEKLKNCFYVDNCVTSVNKVEEMETFIAEAKEIMKNGMFDLRCWVTGPIVLNDQEQTTSVLGLSWDPKIDEMWCNVTLPMNDNHIFTKRGLLSIAQSIFDPIGFLYPTTIIPKMLIQKCWELHLDWDSQLPDDLKKTASEWLRHIHAIKDCRIPRRISHALIDRADCYKTLHVFSDASQSSYAGCVFLRTACDGVVTVQLLLAKARVAPIKAVTIPRLELIAALMATRLASEVKTALQLECREYYWSDSSIVIAWIKRMNGLNVFVSNRVKEIRSRSNVSDWRHVPGEINPADLPSRGVNAVQLLKSKWWEGPSWLKEHPDTWPNSNVAVDEIEVNKEMKKSCLTIQSDCFSDRFTYFSKYSKIIRTIGWCLRFINNCRVKVLPKLNGILAAAEVIRAERVLCLILQKENFQDLDALRKSTKLDLFLDSFSLIRVKTRLTMGEYPANFVAPVLLPKNNIIIERLVEQEHAHLHVGTQTLISQLRDNWWIIGIRCLVKRVVARCVKCKRYKAQACTVPPAPLPAARIQCEEPFDVIGTDLAGPILLKNNEKRWIVLFTCATYRALHIELVDSLTTEDFLLCLRRFIARRGRVKLIYCDNGTNFRGASNILSSINWPEVEEKTSIQKIKWRFLPPQAPWWGGWYERMVRSIKDLLKRTLGKAALLDKELITILYEIEAAINSRPLTYIFDSTENLKPLTPSMFLRSNCAYSSTDVEHADAKALSTRYRYIKQLVDEIKQRFRQEYLSMLTQKCDQQHYALKVGDIVLVAVDGVKRILWPLGLVKEIIPGVDSLGRVAKVKLAHGERIRPLQRLYPLELSSDCSFPVPQSVTSNSDSDNATIVGSPDLSREKGAYITRTGRTIKVPQRLDL